MREEKGHETSLTGPCKHFFCVRVFGPLPRQLVAQRRAVRGDPTQVVHSDELRRPVRVRTGPGDEQHAYVTYGTPGLEGTALCVRRTGVLS